MTHPIFADDRISAILFLCSKSEFKGNQRTLQEAVFQLKRKYKDFFDEFVFSVDLYPYSQLLERVFSRLELSRIISFDNPDYRYFVLTSNGKEYIQRNVMHVFSPEDQKILKEIAKDFEQIVGKE